MIRTILAATMFAGAVISAALPAAAHDYTVGELRVDHPWARAMPPMTKIGAGYMKIENTGGTDDRLVSVATPRSGEVQIHEMTMDGDVARMRHLPDGLPVPAGGSVELAPGGYHLMFTGVSESFEEGEKIAATLTFEKAGTIEVEFSVAEVGAPAPGGTAHSGDMEHSGGMNMDHSSHGDADAEKTE